MGNWVSSQHGCGNSLGFSYFQTLVVKIIPQDNHSHNHTILNPAIYLFYRRIQGVALALVMTKAFYHT